MNNFLNKDFTKNDSLKCRCMSVSTKFIPVLFIFIALAIIYSSVYSQSFTVTGNVSTSTAPVQHALVAFYDTSDTTRKFSTLTDTGGNYQINVITSVKPINNSPHNFELEQNYPNPFSSSTVISYKLNANSDVQVKIYDILGREIRKFTLGMQEAGEHGVLWDGKNNVGEKVAAGMYFCQLQAGSKARVKKMIMGTGMNSNSVTLSRIHNSKRSNLQREKVERNVHLQEGTYTVEIKNTNTTKPKISHKEFPNIIIQQDTTINFFLQEGIMDYSLSYQRQDYIEDTDQDPYYAWSIHLSDLTGVKNKTIITRRFFYSEDGKWSPNGKYIGINHQDTFGHRNLCLYDTANDTLITDLFSSASTASKFLRWTPDGRIIYSAHQINELAFSYYIMNVDGSNKQKLMHVPAFFYPDNYNILFYRVLADYKLVVFHSNLDGTVLDTLVDLTQFVHTSTGGVSIYDFNPNANELLLSFNDPSTTISTMIAKYNISEKRLDTVMVSDSGWKCYRPRFSNNFNKIAIIEDNIEESISRISILDVKNQSKTAIVELSNKDDTGKPQGFEYSPMVFSPDDKYLAYTKMVIQNKPGESIRWITYVYVVELKTKQTTLIDTGIYPRWNPRKPH